MNTSKLRVLALLCVLLAPGISASAADIRPKEFEIGYASRYERGQRVDYNAGASLLPELYPRYQMGKQSEVSAASADAAKNYIPAYIVDQYMQRTNQERPAYAETARRAHRQEATYIVKKGDTLYQIANVFGVSVDLIKLHNRITDPTKLQIGQQLSIPQAEQDMAVWLEEGSQISDVFYATLTAYTAGYESTGKTPSHPAYGITASGAKVKEDHTIAVDPNVIPLGSLVYIEGIGLRKAEDTGSAIKGHKIDVYIPDLEEALEFGVKKNVKVYVLETQKNKNDVQMASAEPR